jgi:hypothetical protein
VWVIRVERLNDVTLHWSRIDASGACLTFDQVVSAWASDSSFREYWVARLRMVSIGAYCWECPPASNATRGSPFECVFVSSPSLARMRADSGAFAEHFQPGCDVVTFGNLGGDATLVAPCPGDSGNFAHLGSFMATATAERQDAFWQAVGHAVTSRIGSRPLWLSTAGHGVAWLHVRLDARPKYYRHAPYRDR